MLVFYVAGFRQTTSFRMSKRVSVHSADSVRSSGAALVSLAVAQRHGRLKTYISVRDHVFVAPVDRCHVHFV